MILPKSPTLEPHTLLTATKNPALTSLHCSEDEASSRLFVAEVCRRKTSKQPALNTSPVQNLFLRSLSQAQVPPKISSRYAV